MAKLNLDLTSTRSESSSMFSRVPAGTYTVDFNASGLPSGIYFYRIKTDSKTEVRKMIFAK